MLDKIKQSVELCVNANDKIGVFISGGFDSTTMFYLVCSTIMRVNPKIELIVFTVPRYDDSSVHSERVYEWMKSVFPEITMSREIIGNPDVHHSKQVSTGIRQALHLHRNLRLIVGDTKNPDEYLGQPGPERTDVGMSLVLQPFFNYDKSVVLSLAKDMEVLDKISEISHTCTESKTLRCNMCWQCKERAWAFKKLELTDVGTM